jgi:hypothetical protein
MVGPAISWSCGVICNSSSNFQAWNRINIYNHETLGFTWIYGRWLLQTNPLDIQNAYAILRDDRDIIGI